MAFFEPEQRDRALFPHDPFKGLVVPRPIGWISTMNRAGQVNLAPYSFFNGVLSRPSIVGFCSESEKDSAAFAIESGEFAWSMATWALREQMNLTSARLPAGVDEMRASGLTPAPSRLVKPPRVAESPAQLECRLLQIVDLPTWDPDERQSVVIGRVVGIHIDETLIKDGRVDIVSVQPIARLGYSLYATVDKSFRMPRPD